MSEKMKSPKSIRKPFRYRRQKKKWYRAAKHMPSWSLWPEAKLHAELVTLAGGKVLKFEPNTKEEKMECDYYVVMHFVNLIITEKKKDNKTRQCYGWSHGR